MFRNIYIICVLISINIVSINTYIINSKTNSNRYFDTYMYSSPSPISSSTSIVPSKADVVNPTTTKTATTSSSPSLILGLKENDIQNKLKELGEPLLDFELIRKTLNAWTRPIPSHYPSMPLVLVGPSGVGKGRLVKALLKDYARYFKKLTTHTTRQPRDDEIKGISYHYVSNDTFHTMIQENKFVEWAKVHDNYYGTSVDELTLHTQEEKICILEIDIQGAKSIKMIANKYGLRPKFVFISPPDVNTLKIRLQERYEIL